MAGDLHADWISVSATYIHAREGLGHPNLFFASPKKFPYLPCKNSWLITCLDWTIWLFCWTAQVRRIFFLVFVFDNFLFRCVRYRLSWLFISFSELVLFLYNTMSYHTTTAVNSYAVRRRSRYAGTHYPSAVWRYKSRLSGWAATMESSTSSNEAPVRILHAATLLIV